LRETATGTAGAGPVANASAPPSEGEKKMNLNDYIGKPYLKPVDLDGPRVEDIVNIFEGQFGKPVLEFGSGCLLSLNSTNLKILREEYGSNSDNLLGKKIEIYIGPVKFNGELQDIVLVRPISPATPDEAEPDAAERPALLPPYEDEIPFN
jgi:hypothetical protein